MEGQNIISGLFFNCTMKKYHLLVLHE
jgi:hypothetical protein